MYGLLSVHLGAPLKCGLSAAMFVRAYSSTRNSLGGQHSLIARLKLQQRCTAARCVQIVNESSETEAQSSSLHHS